MKEIGLFTNLALKYPASARAVAGAILENLNHPDDSELLLKSLNPSTNFKINISGNMIRNNSKWKLK